MLVAVIKKLAVFACGVWVLAGVALLIRSGYYLASGNLTVSPHFNSSHGNLVPNLIAYTFLALGIPCIALFLLLRKNGQT